MLDSFLFTMGVTSRETLIRNESYESHHVELWFINTPQSHGL